MHEYPIWEVGPFNIDLSTFLGIIVSCIVVFVLAKLAVRNLSVENPSKMQNFMEWVIEFVQNLVASAMDLKKGKPYITLGITLIMFIFVSNLLGLPFAIVTEHHQEATLLGYPVVSEATIHAAKGGHDVEVVWWKSPTADLSVTFGLAIMVFLLTNILGMTRNTKHYFKHYLHPYPIFLPVNIIEQLSKPLTLGLRLFANIFAGEVLIATIVMAGWFGIPLLAAWQGFSIFVGAIQAFLFVMLTMVYIAQATIHEEH